MTERPHQYTIRLERQPARSPSAIIADGSADTCGPVVRRRSRCRPPTLAASCTRCPGSRATDDVRLLEVTPADESLESVFAYLVAR